MRILNSIIKIFTDTEILKHIGLSFAIGILLVSLTFLWLRIHTMHGRTIATPNLYGTYIADGKDKLKAINLQTVIADSVYQQGVKPGTIVSQNPPAGFHVKKDRKIHVTIKAYLPEKTIMPNVVGVSLRQAKAILETNGLYIGNITYEPDMALNNVLRQEYKGKTITPGTTIIKGSDITLRLGNGYQTNFTRTPDMAGRHLTEARREIPLNCLNLGSVNFDESVASYTDSINAVIYRQRPTPDQQVRMGSNMSIWLTNDPEKKKTN